MIVEVRLNGRSVINTPILSSDRIPWQVQSDGTNQVIRRRLLLALGSRLVCFCMLPKLLSKSISGA